MTIDYYAEPAGQEGIAISFYRSVSFNAHLKALCTENFGADADKLGATLHEAIHRNPGKPRILMGFFGSFSTNEPLLEPSSVAGMVGYQLGSNGEHEIFGLAAKKKCQGMGSHLMWAAIWAIQQECLDYNRRKTKLILSSSIKENFYAFFGFKPVGENANGIVMERELSVDEHLHDCWTRIRHRPLRSTPMRISALNAA